MATKAEIEHRDKLGRLLKEGDCVAVPHSNQLMIGIIDKVNPKMLRIKKIGKGYFRHSGYLKYPSEVVLLDGPEVSMYLLTNGN